MKQKIFIFALLLFITTAATNAYARDIKMVFWYPGEAGSTAEAQPIIDEFFKYLNGKAAPDIVSGKYFNTVEGGLGYINKDRPVLGIISYPAWVQNKNRLGNVSVFLSTLPAPSGLSLEKYALVGKDEKLTPGTLILSSEPLDLSFVRAELFSNISGDSKITPTQQILSKLKDIGEGKLNAAAILTPTEAATIKRLSAPWAKAIKIIAESKPVPTARVILFDKEWKEAVKFKAILLGLGNDSGAKDILEELRLKGFASE